MTVHYQDDAVTLHHGDALDVLPTLAPESIHCIVTSPPYYGLRDYATAPVHWPEIEFAPIAGLPTIVAPEQSISLGQEVDVWSYIAHVVAVFRAARRALRPDGVLWLNLGDSYAAKARGSDAGWDKSRLTNPGSQQKVQAASLRKTGERHRGKSAGIGEKNLIGVPWRCAFALQADGWTLRNETIWHKPNAMPESVTDRLGNRHEQLFLLTKGPRYWFDLEAIKVPTTGQLAGNTQASVIAYGEATGTGRGARRFGGNPGSTLNDLHEKRNPGDVWSITTKPFPGAHFAVMAPEVAAQCVAAGCPVGGTVLDPFSGSGTTGMAANGGGRRYVGIDDNAAYLDLSLHTRLRQAPLIDGSEASA